MPKAQFINPKDLRKASMLKIPPIPVNQYKKSIKEESKNFNKTDFVRIYHDMAVIREFETMFNLIKTTGEYNGLSYNHPGPAHLSIGQKAAAVGMAYLLNEQDYIFGSHRSHGEILAKGLSAIHSMDDKALMHTMKTFFDGRILSIVEKGHKGNTKSLAIKFLLYGTLAEIFNIMNNMYGMGGQTAGETMGYDIAARVAAGVNRENMHAERVDGYNPLAVIDAYRRKMEILKEKKGPVLLDVLTYRFSGHSPSDASSYRSKEEVEAWQNQDSIISFGAELTKNGIATENKLQKIQAEIKSLVTSTMKLSIDDNISPRMDMIKYPELIGEMMFSNESVDRMDDREPEVNHPMEENPRVQQIAKKERPDSAGKRRLGKGLLPEGYRTEHRRTGVRRPRCTAGGGRIEELDHPRLRVGGLLLPAVVMDHRRDP